MSAPQPDPIMRAVAEVVVNEEKARVAADRELAAELERLRELIDAIESNIVPPELAEQLKSITAALAEPMPEPQQAPPAERVIGPPGEPGRPAATVSTAAMVSTASASRVTKARPAATASPSSRPQSTATAN